MTPSVGEDNRAVTSSAVNPPALRRTGRTLQVSPGSICASPSPSISISGSSTESGSKIGSISPTATCQAPRPYVPAVTMLCNSFSFRSVTTMPSAIPAM